MRRIEEYDLDEPIDYAFGNFCPITLRGELYTGIVYRDLSDNELYRERTFRDGGCYGPQKEWELAGSNSGGERTYLVASWFEYFGMMHGLQRTWHSATQPARIAWHEYGQLRRERCWDEDGKLIRNYKESKSEAKKHDKEIAKIPQWIRDRFPLNQLPEEYRLPDEAVWK